MDRTADLDSALSFVLDRIAEQANASGEPLSHQQRQLLNYLPTKAPANWNLEYQALIPRNFDLERVCALGKAAYLHDRQINPSSLDWEFAFAVFMLNRHPMGGLLHWAGMKLRRAPWDGLQLMATGLVPIAAVALLVLNADGPLFLSVAIGSGCVATMLLMFFASRRVEKQRLNEYIESCRVASRFISTLAG
jgi:hypothetical protein